MENRNGFSRQGSGLWRSLTDGDFEEEDVWAVLQERRNFCPDLRKFPESPVAVKRHLPSATRMIPRIGIIKPRFQSGSTSSSDEPTIEIKQQSAPVNIPEYWSNLSNKRSTNDDDGDGDGDDDDDDEALNGFDEPEIDGDDDWYNSKVPPHEIVARRLARSQISSFSVLEGVGRKLKGRDLRKVRNAVLTRTGFLE